MLNKISDSTVFGQNFARLDDVNNYTGHRYDNILESYYAQARMYNPNDRRFLGEDIIKDGDSWYSYVDGDPVNSIDPNGEEKIVRYNFLDGTKIWVTESIANILSGLEMILNAKKAYASASTSANAAQRQAFNEMIGGIGSQIDVSYFTKSQLEQYADIGRDKMYRQNFLISPSDNGWNDLSRKIATSDLPQISINDITRAIEIIKESHKKAAPVIQHTKDVSTELMEYAIIMSLTLYFEHPDYFNSYINCGTSALGIKNGNINITGVFGDKVKCVISRIHENSRLVKEAEKMGKNQSVQREADELIKQLVNGNSNPGIGTKHLQDNIYYLRGREGARVFYQMKDGIIEILGKSDKSNEQTVIDIVKKIFK